jgi:hypothetical protein
MFSSPGQVQFLDKFSPHLEAEAFFFSTSEALILLDVIHVTMMVSRVLPRWPHLAGPTSSLADLQPSLCTASITGYKVVQVGSLQTYFYQDTHLLIFLDLMQSSAQQPSKPTPSPFLRFLVSCILSRHLDPIEKVLHEYFPKRSQTLAKYLSWTMSNFETKPPPSPHDAACNNTSRLGLNSEYLLCAA